MKKITAEEFDELPIKGAGRASAFYKAIVRLLPGEALIISRKEYTLKRNPGYTCRRIMKRFPKVKYTYGPIADGSGWAIKREK